MLIDDLVFAVVDLETTGGSQKNDDITEVGAVLMWRGEILSEFQSLVNPGRLIPPYIQDLTGITDAMVATAPPLSAVLADFTAWAEESVLAAHPASFDLKFLRFAYERHDLSWRTRVPVCTLKMARKHLPRPVVPDHKLGTLTKHFGLDGGDAHRALDDARATAGVLNHLIGVSGATTLDQIRCEV